jgi:hypothetical protein
LKVKVELEGAETVEQANEFITKALVTQSECQHGERYADGAMNDAHDHIVGLFSSLNKDLHSEIKEIIEHATGTKSSR